MAEVTPAQGEIFLEQLAERAQPFVDRAKSAYVSALARAGDGVPTSAWLSSTCPCRRTSYPT